MNILVSGPTGFVGMALLELLHQSGEHTVFALCREGLDILPPEIKRIEIKGIGESFDIVSELECIDVVVHLAGLAHVLNEKNIEGHDEYHKVNTLGTKALASQCVKAGVGRFVFLSSLKVHGDYSELGSPITTTSKIQPVGQYAQSKYDAELALCQIASQSNLEFVIIRPPLVYGKGVKANFRSLIKLVNLGIPLPLSSASNNLRSLVSRDNLIDLIQVCLFNEHAKNEVFLVSDDQDISTTNLLRMLAVALRVRPRMFFCPSGIIKIVAQIIGKKDVSQKLLCSFQADISRTKELLCWKPKLTLEQGLKELDNETVTKDLSALG